MLTVQHRSLNLGLHVYWVNSDEYLLRIFRVHCLIGSLCYTEPDT
jgi:hypothetical protein